MDQAVLDAIERWPNVPAVFGWLSLSKRGQWRLHPNGSTNQGGFGETIHNQQILSFIDRNYASDEQGRWFFQNGPQRVYVRLDAAPLIVSVTGQPYRFQTHNQLQVTRIERWIIDHQGQLYLMCDHGPAMICDQDLDLVAQALYTDDGSSLLDWWARQDQSHASNTRVSFHPDSSLATIDVDHHDASLCVLPASGSVAEKLGFVANPQA